MKQVIMKTVPALFLVIAILLAPFTTALAKPIDPSTILDKYKTVYIPDPKLNVYLHTKAGIPLPNDLRRVDLYSLSGTLDPKKLGISNAEGLQYCINIEKLDLTGNILTAMPDLSGLTNLKKLVLDSNKFTMIPSEICKIPYLELLDMDNNMITSVTPDFSHLTKLKTLTLRNNKLNEIPYSFLTLLIEAMNISDNPIGELPDNINEMMGLKYFYAGDCKLTKLPAKLYQMTWLRTLNLDYNSIASISKDIKNLTMLEILDLTGNQLQSLPDEICTLSNLKGLFVMENELYSIPSNIGNTKLQELYLRDNNISSLPDTLSGCDTLKELDLRLNRLTSLPDHLDNIHFAYLNVEWNFLNVSVGTKTRTLLDSITASTEKAYLRQLAVLKNITAAAAADSVKLTWEPCSDGNSAGATWKVKNYTVHIVSGGTTSKIKELAPEEHEYTFTSLTPSTDYQYKVSVEYEVDDSPNSFKGSTKYYEKIDVKTADILNTPLPSLLPTATPGTATLPGSPLPAETNAPAVSDSTSGLLGMVPTWLLIILAAVIIIAIGAIVWVILLLNRKKPS